ncbi:DUF1801 domain-containing protein [Roseivivax sp.]
MEFRRDTTLGSFEDLIAAAPAHAGTLQAIRALVAGIDPEAHEKASRRENSVWWGLGPAKMRDGYAYAMPHASHVNLGFFQGASLPDPEGLLEGGGKALRHVKLTSPEAVAAPGLRALLLAALEERRAARG